MSRAHLSILVLLATFGLSATAQTKTAANCMDAKSQPSADYLNNVIERMGGDPAKAEPNFVLVNADITSVFSSGVLKNRVFIDGFANVSKGYYRIVPGLGITMATGSDAVVYFCLVMDHRNAGANLLRIVHLDRAGIFHVFDRKYRATPVALETRPFNEASLLVGGLLAAASVDVKDADKVRTNQPFDQLINKILGIAVRVGVQQVDVKPKKIELVTATRILGVDTLKVHKSIDFDSKWLYQTKR